MATAGDTMASPTGSTTSSEGENNMTASKGRLCVVDVAPFRASHVIKGSVYDEYGATFINHEIDAECGLRAGDRLMAIDGSSVVDAAYGDVGKRFAKVRRYGGRVIVQRLQPASWNAINQEVRQRRDRRRLEQAQKHQDRPTRRPTLAVHMRPIHMTSSRGGLVAGTILYADMTAADAQALTRHCSFCRAFGAIEYGTSSAARKAAKAAAQASKASAAPSTSDATTSPASQPTATLVKHDIVIAAGSFSLLAQRDPLNKFQMISQQAVASSRMRLMVLRPTIPLQHSPTHAQRKNAAGAPKVVFKRAVESPAEPGFQRDAARRAEEDASTLRQLDVVHRELQELTVPWYNDADRMPRLHLLDGSRTPSPLMSLQASPSAAGASQADGRLAGTAILGATGVVRQDLSLRWTVDKSRTTRHNVTLPPDGGMALAQLIQHPDSRIQARVVIHSVWDPALREAGLQPGLALVAVNGDDVSGFSVHDLFDLLLSVHTKFGLEVQLDVCKVPEVLAQVWSPESPRCYGMLVDGLDQAHHELEVEAFLSETGPALIASIGHRHPLTNRIQLGEQLHAINDMDLSSCTYGQVQAMLKDVLADSQFMTVVVGPAPVALQHELLSTRTVTVPRALNGRAGFFLLGPNDFPTTEAQTVGSYVVEVTPSIASKLFVGDRIMQVNGILAAVQPCKTVRDMIRAAPGLELELTVRHDAVGMAMLLEELRTNNRVENSSLVHSDSTIHTLLNQRPSLPTKRYQWPKKERVEVDQLQRPAQSLAGCWLVSGGSGVWVLPPLRNPAMEALDLDAIPNSATSDSAAVGTRTPDTTDTRDRPWSPPLQPTLVRPAAAPTRVINLTPASDAASPQPGKDATLASKTRAQLSADRQRTERMLLAGSQGDEFVETMNTLQRAANLQDQRRQAAQHTHVANTSDFTLGSAILGQGESNVPRATVVTNTIHPGNRSSGAEPTESLPSSAAPGALISSPTSSAIQVHHRVLEDSSDDEAEEVPSSNGPTFPSTQESASAPRKSRAPDETARRKRAEGGTRKIVPVSFEVLTKDHLDQRVLVDGYGSGVLRFVGRTPFDNGKGLWLGVELDGATGTNDGSLLAPRRVAVASANPESVHEKLPDPARPEPKAPSTSEDDGLALVQAQLLAALEAQQGNTATAEEEQLSDSSQQQADTNEDNDVFTDETASVPPTADNAAPSLGLLDVGLLTRALAQLGILPTTTPTPPKPQMTALHKAAFHGQTARIKRILEHQQVDVDAIDQHGRRLPLHWATQNEDPEILSVLLKKCPRLNINACDKAQMTPVMWACYHGRPRNVRRLLKYGAELDEKDIDGKTAMHWCIHDDDVTCLKLLLTVDATFFRDSFGKTLMHVAAEKNSSAAIRLIAAARADAIHDEDKNGRTPLHWAAASGCANAVQELLRRGANPQVTDRRGASPRDYVQAKRLTWRLTAEQEESMDKCNRLLSRQAVSLDDDASRVIANTNVLPWDSNTSMDDTISMTSTVLQRGLEQHLGSSEAAAMQMPPLVRPSSALPGSESRPLESLNQLEHGMWLAKYSKGGLGSARRKFFWLKSATGEMFWCDDPNQREVRFCQARVKSVQPGHDVLAQRSDFAANRSAYANSFIVETDVKSLCLVADSAAEQALWLRALHLLADRPAPAHQEDSVSAQSPSASPKEESESHVGPAPGQVLVRKLTLNSATTRHGDSSSTDPDPTAAIALDDADGTSTGPVWARRVAPQ
ncbi:uncharacterized protein MONBRDRAFT_34181 [Monosiga brevicollis MX1]|uniref:PDZ domain-containing protein n=1 Tax=Monosiga brevicollis TaxID=81824 RepID=A9VA20_MONBE|nr:uncharacterized protein MONBRDRAFT_34181 [Monosiga brevicollis MX1]EDQ85652.1 predicted protein [Monosiga brevicollis MX1]|eukprot:XP_001749601.1 hypothetical protein [Monosiga brevicollis MX1]